MQHEEEHEEEGPSVYFSPTPADRRAPRSLGQEEEYFEDDEEMEQSFDVEELRPSLLLEEMRGEGEEREGEGEFERELEFEQQEEERERAKWLSPIAEASEPNTTINTLSPWTTSPSTDPRHPPPLQPSFSSFQPPIPPSPALAPPTPSTTRTTMTLYHSTPDSRIPRLSQRRPAPSPSLTLNPFALPTSASGTTDLHLIQSLLSAQSDLNSNSSTQKFLLASLVSNLRNEVEGKEMVIRNLKQQVEEGRRGWREAVRELEEIEAARSRAGDRGEGVGEGDGEEARLKLEALEEVVERLTEELEKRTSGEKAQRRAREEEVEGLRRELGRAKVEVRDGEIRLRHARIGLAEAEEGACKAREGERSAVEERERVVREKEEVRRKSREEAMERERVVAMLREEVAVLQHQQNGEGNRDEEVERRMEVVREEKRLEIQIVKDQLAEVEATVLSLRSENHALQSSYAALELSSSQHRQELQHALLDAQSSLSRTTSELTSLQHSKAAIEEELDSTQQRLELVEKELDRLSDEMTLKDDKLALQTSAWEEHQIGMARLMESVGKMEEEAQVKAVELSVLKEQMDEARREAEKLVEDRDRRLTESETQLSARIKKNEALVDECNRLKETVAALRRGSADREVKYARLKKIKAQQDDDIFGLNIALEAKQQEAATWKRQLASARLIAGTPAPSLRTRSQPLTTASRPILGSSNTQLVNPTPTTSTNVPFPSSTSSAKTVVADFSSTASTKPSTQRSRERPFSTSSVPDEHPSATPSRSASTSRLSRKPSVGFGSSARREVAAEPAPAPAPTPARRRSASSASAERASVKENQRPSLSRRRSAEEREETPLRSRVLVAA
ncbi:hypothetical protein BCR35DRAFT_302553 [Leucosporidium creatinivorum]|uniref:Uncharacterized protein n=1 Tax=Leucosporidium creatinivorum TaxID=106004 RepID=A0A1Y2FPP8_9BASI|nr:hypothetical protein BCR35DRAFT_302553 [Leucosporidium creatinivorum]